MRRLVQFALATVLSVTAVPAISSAADLYIGSDDSAAATACGNTAALNRIVSKFRHQVRNVPNLPDVEITDFRRVHQHRYYPASEDSPIARRYCGATAQLSDGREREVWYLIEDGMGFAGMGDGVEFCVSGFDRWLVYNGHCRVLR